jgi:hypothetical protein
VRSEELTPAPATLTPGENRELFLLAIAYQRAGIRKSPIMVARSLAARQAEFGRAAYDAAHRAALKWLERHPDDDDAATRVARAAAQRFGGGLIRFEYRGPARLEVLFRQSVHQSVRRQTVCASRRPSRRARTRRRARTVARTVGSRGDPHPEEPPDPLAHWRGLIAASVRMHAHLCRRTAAARVA